jgi:hypothetical protein
VESALKVPDKSRHVHPQAMCRFAAGERKNNATIDENHGSDSARRPGGDGALPVRPPIGRSVMVQMFRRLP